MTFRRKWRIYLASVGNSPADYVLRTVPAEHVTSRRIPGIGIGVSDCINANAGTMYSHLSPMPREGIPLRDTIESRYGITCFLAAGEHRPAAPASSGRFIEQLQN